MKKLIATMTAVLCTNVFGADTLYSCNTPVSTNQECMVGLSVTANDEIIVVEYTGGKLEYCNGWTTTGCPFTGTKKVLNGEFSSQQLIDVGFKIYSRKQNTTNQINLWQCRLN